MPGQRPILAMSFVASLGMTLEVLACTYPREQAPNFWPLVVLMFYIFLPVPIMISRSVKETMLGLNDGVIKKTRDQALFLTAGIMVCSFALPIILARTPVDKPVVSIDLSNIRKFRISWNTSTNNFPFSRLPPSHASSWKLETFYAMQPWECFASTLNH